MACEKCECREWVKVWLEVFKVVVATIVALVGLFIFDPQKASREASAFLNTALDSYLKGIEQLKTDVLVTTNPEEMLGPWKRRIDALEAAATAWNGSSAAIQLNKFVGQEKIRLVETRSQLEAAVQPIILAAEKETLESQQEELKKADTPEEEKKSELKRVAESLKDVESKISASNEAAATAIDELSSQGFTGLVKQLPARIYLHIGSEDVRARAQEVTEFLKSDDLTVVGIENVRAGNKRGWVPPATSLRYSLLSDKLEAEQLSKRLSEKFGREFKVEFVKSDSVRPRHFEIWFSNDF